MSPAHHALTSGASTINLPSLRIFTRGKLQIDSTASISLDLPDQLRHVVTAGSLWEAVEQNNLWIARVGTCCIEVSAAVNGNSIVDPDQVGNLSRMVKKCELWNRLGLRLEGNGTSPPELPGLISFSIQHPDLNSALLPPSAALVAQFRTFKVSINISKPETRGTSEGRQPKRGKKRKKPTRCKDETLGLIDDDEIFSNLAPYDQQAIDSFMLGLNLPSTNDRTQNLRTDDPSELVTADALEALSSLKILDVLLEQLSFGSGKKYKNLRIVGSSPSLCLTKLAPAVFHIPYLKVISERASLLPIISSSLARMSNAESPSLRLKVAELSRPHGINEEACDSSVLKDASRGIEKHTWGVLLAHSKAPPPRSALKRTTNRLSNTDQGARGQPTEVDAYMMLLFNPPDDQELDREYEVERLHHLQVSDNNYPQLEYDGLLQTEDRNLWDLHEPLRTGISQCHLELPLEPYINPNLLNGLGESPQASSWITSDTSSQVLSDLSCSDSQSNEPNMAMSQSQQSSAYEGSIYDPGSFHTLDQWLEHNFM